MGRPFQHESYLAELNALRERLKVGLAGVAAEPGEPRLSVAELAERITEIKAAHTVDATAERSVTRTQSAEVPVTARIHRRMEAVLAAGGQRSG